MVKKILFAFLLSLILCQTGIAQNVEDAPAMLKNVKERVERAFYSIDFHLEKAAKKLSKSKASPFEIRAMLNEVKKSAPYMVDCAYIDQDGNIMAVEPASPGIEGTNISYQDHFILVRQTKMPVVSKCFLAVEGFYAEVIQYPIISGGSFIGSISALIRPETLLNLVVENELKGTDLNVWLMQDDGRIIYDKDNEEIGKNLFEDKYYQPFEDLLRVGRMITSEADGVSEYVFYAKGSKNKVNKKAYWSTIDMYGTKWKIVLTDSLTPVN